MRRETEATTTHQPESWYKSFILSSVAATGAVCFTNPAETVKTRMQLQTHGANRLYKNFAHAFYTISRTEGIFALQKGLSAAVLYQIAMNGTRLCIYDTLAGAFREKSFASNIFSGACAGVVAALVGSPLFLVKTRLQSASQDARVGTQYGYRGVAHGLTSVFQAEGVRGLYRGASASCLRTGMGGSVQLASYDKIKTTLLPYTGEGTRNFLASGLVTGFVVITVMNPPDVISTRLYNQKVVNGVGQQYTGIVDCALKTVRGEGLSALYKGAVVHWLRLGPHSLIMLTLLDMLKARF